MAQLSEASTSRSNAHWDDERNLVLKPKHKIFLSHSGAQKDFVEYLCFELERCYRFPFFDKRQDSLPIGENFPQHIFGAIRQCQVGVVILSDEFFTSKWPMMELVAMVDEVERRKSSFKIIPVFLCTSLEEFDDPNIRMRWLLCWQELAKKDPMRVYVEKWKATLKYIRPINSLIYKLGMEILKFQEKIVDAICEKVPPEIRLEDSHIQGRLRLCKVIQDKILMLQKDKIGGVCIVGLYGMGGIGKTSICKVLCNEFFTQFHGRVCHAELERKSEEELLREVLKKLTSTSSKVLDGFNKDQLYNGLRNGIIKEAMFLTLDNMGDTLASIKEVKSYLSTILPPGSIVMVTARSKDSLMRIRFIDKNNCMEMPELEEEEAKSLFVKSADFESRNGIDDQLVQRCIKRCHFRKDSGSTSYHYHPLALNVLGSELGFIDPKEWGAQLDNVDEDIFNASRDNGHPVFSILRKSFDTLAPEDQLLFMDVVLFLPSIDMFYNLDQDGIDWDVYKWLGKVHRIPSVDGVMGGLRRLKAKSLLESLGDGVKTRPGIHDLWRAFCVAETKFGELRCRRWMYEAENCTNELVESCPSGTCWERVVRMAFVYCEMISKLERANFAHFSNVTVLKIEGRRVRETLVLDLSGLSRLKSLVMWGRNLHVLGLPRNLIFLRATLEDFGTSDAIIDGFSQQLVDEIGRLEELQYLQLNGYLGGKLPDMTRMISMQVAIFNGCRNVATLTGLSSKVINLRVLILRGCKRLRNCPHVGDLVQLEVLIIGCAKLEGLPDLRKLSHLRKLEISYCRLITELQGLDDLVALEELHATSCNLKLPDMSKLSKLQVLNIGDSMCSWKTNPPGLVKLTSLKELKVNFHWAVVRPNLRWLTKLQKLDIRGCSLVELGALHQLTMLESLSISRCRGVAVELPDLQSLILLQTLHICNSGFKNLLGLMNLSALERLTILACDALERLPDMQRLTRLKWLSISDCAKLRGWDGTWGQAEVSPRRLDGYDLPDSEKLVGSRDLLLSNSRSFDLTTFGSLSHLQRLVCFDDLLLLELPDLSIFPRLEFLFLAGCQSLRQLSSREPMNFLSELHLKNCRSLAILPDLSNFSRLRTLTICRCHLITTLRSSGPLVACAELGIDSCNRLQYLPDLGKTFPALKVLTLKSCRRVTRLSSSVPMPALEWLTASGCRRLSRDDLYQLQAVCPQCEVRYHEETSHRDSNDSETSSDGGEGDSDDNGEGGSDDGEDSDGVEIHDDVDDEDFPNPTRARISGVEPGNDLD